MVKWTAEADARLLTVVLQDLATRGVKVEYATIAEGFGQGVSAKAIEHRFFALRKADSGTNLLLPKTPPTSPTKRRNQKVAEGGVTKRKAS